MNKVWNILELYREVEIKIYLDLNIKRIVTVINYKVEVLVIYMGTNKSNFN